MIKFDLIVKAKNHLVWYEELSSEEADELRKYITLCESVIQRGVIQRMEQEGEEG